MKRFSPSLTFVFITLLLDVLGFGLIIPVAPKLVALVQGLPVLGAESEASVSVGLLTAMYAAMQFVFSPILGSLSDRFGRRPVILVALLGSGIDYLAMSLAPNLAWLFVTRAINGISGASMTACSAYVADVTPPEKRAAGFGFIGAAFGLGFVLGPLAGGFLGEHNIRWPFIAAGVLTLINWLYGYFVLPESLPQDRRRAFSWKKANPVGTVMWISKHKVVATLAVSLFLLNVAQFSLHATWVLSMSMRFGWGPKMVGLSLFAVGITAAVVQGGLARKIIPALGERACLFGGLVIAVLAFTGYGLATQEWMIFAIITAASIGGVSGPAAQGIMSKAVPPTEQGLLQGALTSLSSVANVVGPLIGAGVFRYFTSDAAPTHLPGAPFLAGAALSVLAMIPVMMVWKRMPGSVERAPDEAAGTATGV